MLNELAHIGEELGVVGGGGQNQLAVAERVLHRLGHVLPRQVADGDLGAVLGLQLFGQQLHGLFGVAVDGGVGQENALVLGGIGRPGLVEAQIIAQVLRQNGAVEGTDDGDVQAGRLLQQLLHLSAVFADDAEVVAPRLTGPVLLNIQSAELAEAVGGEKDFVRRVIGDHDLGPVDHGGHIEAQSVAAQGKGVALCHGDAALGTVSAEELLHHDEGLAGGDDGGLGIEPEEIGNVGRMVRLHVLHDQIVRLSAAEDGLQIVQPFVGETGVHRVHDGDLLVQNDVGIVGHAVGHRVLTLEQVHLMVVYTDIKNVVGNAHWLIPPKLFF